jgi:hypothetical protein
LDLRHASIHWRGGRPALARFHQEFEARPSMTAFALPKA